MSDKIPEAALEEEGDKTYKGTPAALLSREAIVTCLLGPAAEEVFILVLGLAEIGTKNLDFVRGKPWRIHSQSPR